MGIGLSKGKSKVNLMANKTAQMADNPLQGCMNDEAVANMMARRGSLDSTYLQQLSKRSHFSYKEIELMYTSFRMECGSAEFTKDQFKVIYSRLHPVEECEEYSSLVFQAFDTNGNGSVDFEEFVLGLSSSCRGSVEEKLHFSFQVQDINHDGYVTKEEMITVVSALCEVLDVKLLSRSSTVRQHVDRLFHILDTDRDGVLCIDDFLSAHTEKTKRYDWVSTSLLCHVLL
jgi:Ca2+-binding EF-hand superfamily protein